MNMLETSLMNMKTLRSCVFVASVAGVAMTLAGTANAATITGTLSLTGYETLSGSNITFDFGSTLSTFGETGNYTELGSGTVTFVDQGSPVNYTTLPSVVPTNLTCGTGCIYSATNGTDTATFVLDTETVSTPGGHLIITGTGTASLTGYSPTEGSFTLTTQGTEGQLSFSTTTVVPVPLPAALPLLSSGIGMIVLLARRKKLKVRTTQAA
jgi:hypothetical protein